MLFKRPNTSIRAHFVLWIQPSIFIHLSKLPRHLFALSVMLVHWRVSATANESGRNERRSKKLWITLKISYSHFDFFPSSVPSFIIINISIIAALSSISPSFYPASINVPKNGRVMRRRRSMWEEWNEQRRKLHGKDSKFSIVDDKLGTSEREQAKRRK